MRRLLGACVLACGVLLPSLAYSQTTLAGVVRDSSGAVLPGVTVEAAGAALIERARTAVSDGSGQYRITDLPPGTYSVTFSLQGFTRVVREGVALAGSGVTTINADLRVGALEETITVTGETPVVDVQSTRREMVITAETLATAPVTRFEETVAGDRNQHRLRVVSALRVGGKVAVVNAWCSWEHRHAFEDRLVQIAGSLREGQ